jgi:SAM-dependent methyltransferase
MSEWNNYLVTARRSLFGQAHAHRILLERIMIEVPRGGSVLEAGCGMAYLAKLLADAGYKITAGDLDEEVIASACLGFQSSPAPINYVKLDLLDLTSQFQAKSFDAIIHSGVMEHFPDNLIIRSFSEQRAIANLVIFKVPNANSKLSPAHFGDERFLSNKHWISLLKQGGFTDVAVYGGESLPNWSHLLPYLAHLYPTHLGSNSRNKLANILSKWRVQFSRHSIFVCR